jgi:hypothetical protein
MMLRTIHRWLAIISTVKSDIWVSIVIYTYFTIITINNQDVQDHICGVAAAVKVNGILFFLHYRNRVLELAGGHSEVKLDSLGSI